MTTKSSESLDDQESRLLERLKTQPARVWVEFVHAYSDFVFTLLTRMGFDYDEAMEQFVFVFEKFKENDYRRLRKVNELSDDKKFRAWLGTVVRNLALDWLRTRSGRKRVIRRVASLTPPHQRVFELYFFEGLSPSLIHEELQREVGHELSLSDTFERLEEILRPLDSSKIWRLLGHLRQGRSSLGLADRPGWEASSSTPNPEQNVLKKEIRLELESALTQLDRDQRLVLALRFEEGQTKREIANSVGWPESKVDSLLRAALYRLRRRFSDSRSGSNVRHKRKR